MNYTQYFYYEGCNHYAVLSGLHYAAMHNAIFQHAQHCHPARLLCALLKPGDQLILLAGAGHNGMTDNPDYRRQLAQILR